MLSKGIFLLLMCIFTNSVTCLVGNNSKKVLKEKNVEPRYNFNHPPSAENYNPIPVALVNEDESDYSGRTKDQTKLNKPDENVNVANEKYEQTTLKEREDVPTTAFVSNVDNKTKDDLVPRPTTLDNMQIPVTVVYESHSDSNQKSQRKTDTVTEKRRHNYSRKVQNKANVVTKKEQITQVLNVDTEKPRTNVETRTFKKRTEGRSPVVPIIESENYVFSHSGNFHYSYESGDGTKAHSEGKLKTVDEEAGESVVGGFSYTDKDGNDFSLSYTADENGYRPVGDHLPTPPPIPPAIARALAYLATATPEPVTKRPVKSKPIVI